MNSSHPLICFFGMRGRWCVWQYRALLLSFWSSCDRAFLCLLFVACAGIVNVQAQQWQTYTSQENLADDFVLSIFQAQDGAMWFGTLRGVSRYDGIWQTFTAADGLAADRVSAVFQSRDGAMWFGTGDRVGNSPGAGVSRYDGEKWQTFTVADGLGNNSVLAIFQARDGAMWFGMYEGGVSRYDGEKWQTFTKADGLAGRIVETIFQATDGSIWVTARSAAGDGGVSRYDGEKWQTFTKAGDLPIFLITSGILADDGSMWFGIPPYGVSRYDGEEWEIFTAADGLASNIVVSVMQSGDGAIWVGTLESGVSRYNGTNWETFTEADGLVSNSVISMYQTLDGAVWFGTSGAGVSRLDVARWETLKFGDVLAGTGDVVRDIFQARDGALWFGTQSAFPNSIGGAIRVDRDVREIFIAGWGLVANSTVQSITQAQDGAMWFGTDRGVSRYDGETWKTFTTVDGLAGNDVLALLQSQDGAMWFGTFDSGVSRYDGETWKTFTASDGLADNQILSIFQARDGAMWFGTGNFTVPGSGGGVSRYDGETWETFAASNGLGSNTVLSIFQARDGVMWFGTVGGGISRYDGETWETFPEVEGLSILWVAGIVQSQDGAMWFATRSGAIRFDGTFWQAFGVVDGLASNTLWSVLQADDGRMWFGTGNGASSFRRPEIPLVQTVIQVPLFLGGNRIFVEGRGFEIGSERRPPISFALMPGRVQPEQEDWSSFAQVNGFELTDIDLSNGEWSFYLRAKDRNGNVDPTAAFVTFTVDLVSPTVVINSPRRNDAVSGEVTIEGSVFDASAQPDLVRFSLSYERVGQDGKVASWLMIDRREVDNPEGFRIEDAAIGTWDTAALQEPFGRYILRVQAEDRLGHTSEHQVPVRVVSALEDVKSREGGDVMAVGGTVLLMVPPNGLATDVQVQIVFRPARELPVPPAGATATGIAYGVGPEGMVFNKRSTLTIGYNLATVAGMVEADLAVFELLEGAWVRLGGTVDATVGRISVGIQKVGTYALFEAPGTGGSPEVSEMVCQPRIISPNGSLYPGVSDISFRLGAAVSVDVRVYGVSGNLVREVVLARRMSEGLNTVQWDGRDRNGKAVRDGVYVVVIEAEGRAANQTVGVLNR
ncbi:MAG: hypothetical protein O2954_02240 [bacterium]|nr:hypothetical protein [bacterium]